MRTRGTTQPLIMLRARGLSGPFSQNVGSYNVHTAGNYLTITDQITLIGQFLVPDPDHIMTGVLLGEGDLTVSRAASVDIPDADGTDQTFGTSEAAWGGGRVTGAVGSRVVYDTDALGVEYADPTWLAVTAGDSHTLDSSNLSNYQGALYVEVYMAGDDNLINGFLYRDTGDLTLDDGTTTVTAAMSVDEWHEVGIAWSTVDAQMDLLLDGSWIGAVAYDGSMLSGVLDLFRDAANGGRMRNLRIYSDGSSPSYGFDIFVDSIYGDDGNTGTAYNDAFATLSAAETAALAAGNSVKIGVAYGSTLRGTFDLSTIDGLTLGAYGASADGLPQIRCDEILDTSWNDSTDRADANTNVYSRDLLFDLRVDEEGYPLIWQDDTPLTWVANVATCQSTPGSFYVTGLGSSGTGNRWEGGTWTYYIHPVGSTDPRSDGSVYEYNTHGQINANDDCTISNIWFRRPGSRNGVRLGHNALVQNCLFDGANVHDLLSESGKYYRCCGFNDIDDPREGHIGLEFYVGDGTGYSCEWDQCTYVGDPAATNRVTVGIGGHTAGGAEQYYDSVTITDCSVEGATIQTGAMSVLFAAERLHVKNPQIALSGNPVQLINRDSENRSAILDCWIEADAYFAQPLMLLGGYILIDGLRTYGDSNSALAAVQPGQTLDLELTRSVMCANGTGSRFRMPYQYNSADFAKFRMSGCLYDKGSSSWNCGGASYTDTYISGNAYEGFGNHVIGTTVYNLTNLQLNGYGADNVVMNPLISDPENGDFTAEAVGLPANSGLERTSITYTPIPATLVEAEEWILSA